MRSSLLAGLATATIALLFLPGCAPGPPPGRPVSRAELEELAGTIAADYRFVEALRC